MVKGMTTLATATGAVIVWGAATSPSATDWLGRGVLGWIHESVEERVGYLDLAMARCNNRQGHTSVHCQQEGWAECVQTRQDVTTDRGTHLEGWAAREQPLQVTTTHRGMWVYRCQ